MSEIGKNAAGTLQMLWWAAIGCGAIAFAAGIAWVVSPGGPGFDWIWVVAAFGLAAAVYNIAFFFLCSIYLPRLADLVEDDTKVEGDNVVHVVKHAETGNERLDFFVRAYATARGVTAAAIGACILTGIALIFF